MPTPDYRPPATVRVERIIYTEDPTTDDDDQTLGHIRTAIYELPPNHTTADTCQLLEAHGYHRLDNLQDPDPDHPGVHRPAYP